MKIYKDIKTSDELFSDPKEVERITLEIDCNMIEIMHDEDNKETVNDIIYFYKLQNIQKYFEDKKHYKIYMKEYINSFKETFSDDKKNKIVEDFTKILKNYNNYELYAGESWTFDDDKKGVILHLNYRENKITPYFTVLNIGLESVIY
jgi:hypothetical protein